MYSPAAATTGAPVPAPIDHAQLLLEVATQVLASSASDAELAQQVFDMICQPLRADVLANYRVIGNAMELATSAGMPPAMEAAARHITLGDGLCGWVAAQRVSISADTSTIDEDPRAQGLKRLGVRAYACHPLLGRDGRVLGTFAVASRLHAGFTNGEIAFLQTVSHFLAMAWDRQHAARELAEVTAISERRRRLYETILSNTLDLAYVFDLDHRFLYANEILLAMWGRTWDEAIGKTCIELGYPDWHAAMHDREIEQVKATRQPIRGEVPFNGTFGRRIYDYIFVPVLGPNGDVEAIAGTTRDITDLKHAEDRLREQDQRKDEFIATLAHELRNPLAPLRTGLSILGMSPTPELAQRTRDTMQRQFTHMVRLIDDLLDVARITTGKLQLQRSHIDLRDAVLAGLEVSRPLIDAGHHPFTIGLPDDPLPMDGDATRIAQAVSNLLNNATQYTPAGGAIALTVARDGEHAEITVRDSGAGLTPAMLPDLFDLFTQAGTAASRPQCGLGIGLALVRRVVELHGGLVAAQSAGLGLGSAFTVRLPLAPVDQSPEPDGVTPPAAAATPGRRVLVVDDNIDAADSMALLLGLQGHVVAVAHRGEAAINEARTFKPDVVLLDIGLPDIDGYEVARRLRREPDAASAMLVALTGWGTPDDRQRAQAAGFDHHITKPANMDALETLLQMPHPRTGEDPPPW